MGLGWPVSGGGGCPPGQCMGNEFGWEGEKGSVKLYRELKTKSKIRRGKARMSVEMEGKIRNQETKWGNH